MIAAPQPFVIREECEKAAFQNGFRRRLGEQNGWASFASTTAQGNIHLAAGDIDGPWFLALDHTGIIKELALPAAAITGPGKARYALAQLGELYTVLDRVYALGVSLPDAPLREFEIRTANMPKATEAERRVVQRIGQNIFRERLLDYWQSKCPLTGISDPPLLRASHIKPWSACDSDIERLDIHNGLLLSALWDAAFDKGLVTFAADGVPLFAANLSVCARQALSWCNPIPLSEKHRISLEWHHRHIFESSDIKDTISRQRAEAL